MKTEKHDITLDYTAMLKSGDTIVSFSCPIVSVFTTTTPMGV